MIRRAVRRRKGRPRGGLRLALDALLALAVLAAFALVSLRLEWGETRQSTGRPVVNDGDSLTLAGERIRLRGIDAPEFGQTCRKAGAAYPCGREARAVLDGLIGGRPVTCIGWERDRYGRLLAACSVEGVDLAHGMVEQGWAVAYGAFDDVEEQARRQGAGLWAGEFDRPQRWREVHGSLAESEHGVVGRIVNWLRSLFGSGPEPAPAISPGGVPDEAL